jgi:hypothetical protein
LAPANYPLNFFAKASALRVAQVTTVMKCEYLRQFASHLGYLSQIEINNMSEGITK